ncbi:Glutamyl-tRNA Reductase, chloroplast precursor [Tribonema minus]|uniref:Glutamyl-tRNA reductase n=1 Tax=Tribonema minus TaxID=303371 RepID=A0A836C898_9STRA|nr:Glutamyl-tRNA Reductase, chloroplast precursor [Tribonema minus]
MAAEGGGGKCPIKRITQSVLVRLVWLHVLLFLSFLGLGSGHDNTASPSVRAASWSKCPLARASRFASTAFQHSPHPDALPVKAITCTAGPSQIHSASPPRSQFTLAAFPRTRTERDTPLRRRKPHLFMSAIDGRQSATADAAAPVKADKKRKENASNTLLNVHVIGLSHHNAAVEVREKLAVPESEWNAESARLCENPSVLEASVLSTCNRFEVYVAAADAHAAIRETIQALQERSGLSQAVLRRSLFILSGEDAVWHVLRVSAGLDSLIVGEGQILSQVRQCYLHGTEEDGYAGKVVARLLNTAVSAGKRVRSETSISKGAVSISSAAAEFSKFRCEMDNKRPFEGARIAIVGAGTMSRLLLVHLQSLGIRAITLVNRSMPRCLELQAEFTDMALTLKLADEMEDVIAQSDIVYTGTSATACIVTRARLEELGIGKAHPVMFVDISVPRNVEAECNDVEGVFAYDVDDLKMVVARNTALRRKEMLDAEVILAEEQDKFQGWQQSLTAIPAISKMQEKFEAMRADEVKKAANKLGGLSPKEMEVVEKLSKGIVNKMLHGPMSALRQPEGPEQKKRTLQILKAMFKLEKEMQE